MGPCKARAIRLDVAAVGSLVLGAETQPIEKQRGGRGLSIRWPPFGWENTTTNQKLAFSVGRILGRARDRSGTCWGGFCYRLGAANKVTKKQNNKIRRGLDGCRLAKKHTTTNQKQAAAMEGTMERRHDKREAWGSAISLFFGGGEV